MFTIPSAYAGKGVDYLRYLDTDPSIVKWNRQVTGIYKNETSLENIHQAIKENLKTPNKDNIVYAVAALVSPNLTDDPEMMKALSSYLKNNTNEDMKYKTRPALRHRLIADPDFRTQFSTSIQKTKEGKGLAGLQALIKDTDATFRFESLLRTPGRTQASIVAETLLSKDKNLVNEALKYSEFMTRTVNLADDDPKILPALRELIQHTSPETQNKAGYLLSTMAKIPYSEEDARLIEKAIIADLKSSKRISGLTEQMLLFHFPVENYTPALHEAFAESLKNNKNTGLIIDMLGDLKTDNENLKKLVLAQLSDSSPDERRQIAAFLRNNAVAPGELKRLELQFRIYPELVSKPARDLHTEMLIQDFRSNPIMNDGLRVTTREEVMTYGDVVPKTKDLIEGSTATKNEVTERILKTGTIEEKHFILSVLDNNGVSKIPKKIFEESIRPLLKHEDLTVRIQAAMIMLDKNVALIDSEKQEILRTFSQSLNVRAKDLSIATHERFLSKVPPEYYKSQIAQTALAETLQWLRPTGVVVVLRQLTDAGVNPVGPLRKQLFAMLESLNVPAYLTPNKQEEILKLLSKTPLTDAEVLRLLAAAERRPDFLKAVTEAVSATQLQNMTISDKVIDLCVKHGFDKCSGNTAQLSKAVGTLDSVKSLDVYHQLVKDLEEADRKTHSWDKHKLKDMGMSVLEMGETLKLPISDKGQTSLIKILLNTNSLRQEAWQADALAKAIDRFGAKEVALIDPAKANDIGTHILGMNSSTTEQLRKPFWDLFRESANMSEDPVGIYEVLIKQAKYQKNSKNPLGNVWVTAQTSLELLNRGHNPKKAIEKNVEKLQTLPAEDLKKYFGEDKNLLEKIQSLKIGEVPSNGTPTSYCAGDIVNLFKNIK